MLVCAGSDVAEGCPMYFDEWTQQLGTSTGYCLLLKVSPPKYICLATFSHESLTTCFDVLDNLFLLSKVIVTFKQAEMKDTFCLPNNHQYCSPLVRRT